MEQARSRTFLDSLAGSFSNVPAQYEAELRTIEDVQALLPEDSVILQYVTTGLLVTQTNHPHRPLY